jgi:hypothetical protein
MYTHTNTITAVSSLLNIDKENPTIDVNEGNIRHIVGLLGLYINPSLDYITMINYDVAKGILADARANMVDIKSFINDVHDNMKYLKGEAAPIDIIIYETIIKTICTNTAKAFGMSISITKCVGWHKRIITIVKDKTIPAIDITADDVINA